MTRPKPAPSPSFPASAYLPATGSSRRERRSGGIPDQVLQTPLDQADVGEGERDPLRDPHGQTDLFLLRVEPELLQDVLGKVAQRKPFFPDRDIGGIERRQLGQLGDQR